jgi:hypothetical protein
MLRVLLTYILPLVAPFVIYELWRMLARAKYGGTGTGDADPVDRLPWTWLAGAGVVLVAITVVSLALFSDWEDGSVYEPARLIDGTVQPGRFVKPGGQ